jgi:ADP-heptose:LPS heptosyltransferase
MSPSNNILIYRLGSLGDTVIALPCFHLIRQFYPGSKIIILTNQPVSGKAAPAMAILENSGLCDEAISYPVETRNPYDLLTVWQMIREKRPRILFNLAAGRGFLKSVRDQLFFRACGIQNIVGTPWHRRDFLCQPVNDGEMEPESQRLASRLASLGAMDLADRRFWDLRLTQMERNQALDLLPAKLKRFIVASVGTKLPVKDWGEANWEKLLVLLSKKIPGITLILLGAPDEWERSERLRNAWTGQSLNLSGKTSPRISAAILERCGLFIGHDSGPMHLASAVGAPTLGLFSWQNPPGQWFPGHRSWKFTKVLYPPLPGGVWHPNLQFEEPGTGGIQILSPDLVFRSAMELWHASLNEAGPGYNHAPAENIKP